MKPYIKQAVKELLSSDKPKIELILKSKNDFKKNPVRLAYNKVILTLQQKLVPCHLKNFILRTTGMHIGHDTCIPHDITFDSYFPELIFLDKGCLIGGDSIVITHEIKDSTLFLGKVRIKERAMIGGLCTLKPGAVVNKNSILNMKSELDTEMPEAQL
jgi:acetyltransferase-like isoleucine patch superfamily enzyme